MNANPSLSLLFLAAVALSVAAQSARAQSSGVYETVGPNGVTQTRQPQQLSPVQRNAIYNAVMQQRLRGSGGNVTATIGAPAPPLAALPDLPDQAAPPGTDNALKYATVDGEIVVVDPITMRVIDIIREGARP